MNLEEYAACDATELAKQIDSGAISPKDAAQLASTACEKVNPQINAVIELFSDRIDTLDESTLGDGPFRGVPFLIKDLGPRIKGRLQESGSRMKAGYVADETDFVTQKLMDAGFNIIGRTTCPEYGLTGTTESIQSGATRNPWNTDFSTGGSSGGSAASVAAGIVPIAHTNDGGGSTRLPASICGNVGLKHSRGRISYAPVGDDLLFPLFSEGVNSQSVRDVAAFLDCAQGPAPGEGIIFPKHHRPFVEEVSQQPEALRIAVCNDVWDGIPMHPDIRAEMQRIGKLCQDAGHHVEEVVPPIELMQSLHAFKSIWCIDIAFSLDMEAAAMARPIDDTTLEPMTLKMYEFGKQASVADRLGVTAAMGFFARQLGQFFTEYDLLLTPVLAQPTVPIGSHFTLLGQEQSLDDWFDDAIKLIPYTPLNNMTGTPAISLPLCQDPNGMPLGAHFMAPIGYEDRLLNIAGQLEQIAPWRANRPSVHVATA